MDMAGGGWNIKNQNSEESEHRKFFLEQPEHRKSKRSEHQKYDQNAQNQNIKKNIKSQRNQTFNVLIFF